MKTKDHSTRITYSTNGIFNCLYDDSFTLLDTTSSFYDFVGYSHAEVEELFHGHLLEFIYEEDRAALRDEIARQLALGSAFMCENRLTVKDGRPRYIWVSGELGTDKENRPFLHCIFHDITDARENQDKLFLSEQRYEIVLSQMQDIIFELDCQSFDIYYSPNFEKKFGYQIPVKGFPDSMFETDIIYEADKPELRRKFQSLLKGADRMNQEYRIRHKDGHYLWVDVHATVMRDSDGQLLKILGIISDINDRKMEILETRRFANTDPLTGLLNRRECIRRITRYTEMQKELSAFLLLDIDNFKSVNDTCGHLFGDAVLTGISEGLLTIFRKDDVVSRISGDEFVIFMTGLHGKEQVVTRLEDILSLFEKAAAGCDSAPITCSIGVCFYPEHGNDFTTLLAKADSALYEAKEHHKGGYCFYNHQAPSPALLSMGRKPLAMMQKSFHDRIIEYVFRIFLETEDTRSAVPLLFDFIGRAFHADRIYICQRGAKGGYKNIYHWCGGEVLSMEDSLEQVFCLPWEAEGNPPVTVIRDASHAADPDISKWLMKRRVKAIFLNWMGDPDKLQNLIGFEDCHGTRQDIDEERYTLHMVSEILNLFLVKEYHAGLLHRQNDERISFLMDSIPGGMLGVYFEENLPLYFINTKMLGYLGFENQEEYYAFIDGNAANSIYEEERETVISHILKSLEHSTEYEIEYRMRKKDGSLIWVNDKGRRIRTVDGRDAIISLCIDISEQKEYENQLAIYRNASNGGAFVVSMDDNYTLLYANDIFYLVFETTKEEMKARNYRGSSYIYSEDKSLARDLLNEARASHRPYFQWTIRITTGKGNLKWILINASFETQEIGLVMNGFVIDVTEKYLLEEAIAHKELVYRTALKETHINVWEYDIKNHTLILTESGEEHHSFKGQLKHVPQSLIEMGYIHPASSQDLMDMYRKLDEGEPHVTADILTRSADQSRWWWERINYTTLYDNMGNPSFAVAVGEDISQQKEAEALYQQELQLRAISNEGMILSFRCNLDKDQVEYINGPDMDLYGKQPTYEDLLLLQDQTTANEEDRVRFYNLMNRKSLYDAYYRGDSLINCEYRKRDRHGRLLWVNACARLVRNVQNGDLYLYGTLQDIDQRKSMELALKNRAQRDTLTGTYNKETAIQIIEDTMELEQRQGSSYAMLVFHVDNFTRIVHNSGYTAADQILKELGNQLTTRSSRPKIVGRFYGDEFVAFLYGSPSPEEVRQYAEATRKTMNLPYMFPQSQIPVSISAGMVMGGKKPSTFYQLYEKAKTAVEDAKSNGRNRCVFYSPEMDDESLPHEIKQLADMSQTDLRNEGGENILLKCLLSLSSSADFRKAMDRTLKEAAEYYGAERAYVIELEQDSSKLLELYEWTREGTASIRSLDSQLLYADQSSSLQPAKNQFKRLAYIENIETLKDHTPELYQWLRDIGVFSFFLSALEDEGRDIGYIGVDNPTRNTGNISLIDGLRYFLESELIKRRLQKRQEFLSYHDELTGALNRNSYKNYCASLKEERLISLGVISLDINGLKNINRIHGNSYGDDIVRYTAKVLKEEFPSFRVYRFTGDEFLGIGENIAYDSFLLQTRAVRDRLKDVCSISVGTAWSDVDINASSLINSADERRLIAKQNCSEEKHYKHQRSNTQIVDNIRKALSQGYFMMYLQPKIDSRNNELYGAEALIRYQSPDTGLVPPGKFVPYLETLKLIHYLDFFVYEEVCKIQARWKKQGLPLFPISLNFSRSTLLEESLIARMDEIADKYQTDKSLIEIEITESLGEVERNTISVIGGQIVQAGCLLSLDDFGSKYSNLSFLSAIDFHTLKLDKGLVNNLVGNENARIIVKNILKLCHELNIQVVAEGVESAEQLEVLKKLGCWYVQGYYYNKPMPAEEFERMYVRK